jgi:hypothetical protein
MNQVVELPRPCVESSNNPHKKKKLNNFLKGKDANQ